MPNPVEKKTLSIGETKVEVHRWEAQNPKWKLIHVHDNEATALRASLALLSRRDIELTSLVHRKQRRVRFKVDGKRYSIDPNRCFSRLGIQADMKKWLGFVPDDSVIDAVEEFSKNLLAFFWSDQPEIVIAIHNNSNNGSLTIDGFKPGGEYADDADQVFINPDIDRDDFFLVTRQTEFDHFSQMNWNVVLQSQNVTDDGSLSIYCMKNGIPYVNVESQVSRVGHEWQNMVMIMDALYVVERTV